MFLVSYQVYDSIDQITSPVKFKLILVDDWDLLMLRLRDEEGIGEDWWDSEGELRKDYRQIINLENLTIL